MDENKIVSKPYMGNFTSAQIGDLARTGELGGEMVKRMIKQQEIELMDKYDKDKFE